MSDAPLAARDPERVALKEWAVLVSAMARGDLIAMIRKGGIRENRAGFDVRHDRFLLYPTYFHEKLNELAERFHSTLDAAHANRPPQGMIELRYVANVAAVWQVTELDRLRAIDGEHGLTWGAVESRFRYRDDPHVHVVAVRIAVLPAAVSLPEVRRYTGCVSWVKLDQDVDVSGARPVLDDQSFATRMRALEQSLGAAT
ncbi:MAG: DUF1802 family protein [Gemmatimonadaceae bacterium]|nr:DUF1802 family protein [Gemmatimonadaceae bacterium]